MFGQFIQKGFSTLSQQVELLRRLNEDAFLETLRAPHLPKRNKFASILYKILSFFSNFDEVIMKDLAIGIAAFNRCPADLPIGSELYPEQMQAAMVLTQPAVLQMDTGEGKTYALLPAAFALSRKYGKVYIVCANSYLAFRDASRTKKYWDYVGLSISFCGQSTEREDLKWKADVIYTTLDVLAFKNIKDDLNKSNHETKLHYDVIIIDEIDAVLSSDSQSYSIVHTIKSSVYDWNMALDYSKNIINSEHITIDWSDNTAQLNVDGIEALRDFIGNKKISQKEFGRIRKAVEVSYVSMNMQADREYVIKDEIIIAVNQLNGELQYGMTYDWMIPLSILLGVIPPASRITLHKITNKVLLQQFKHLSGMSGTAQEDMAEYFFSYKLPIAVIPPRKDRFKGTEKDSVFKTKKGAVAALCSDAIKAIESKRPVLIGTQSISDVILVSNLLEQRLNETDIFTDNVKINPITGKDLSSIANIYENGGNYGSVIVATQVAGRGVDIRLSNEARANGGIALFGLDRALEARQDKQFLGRVGRQGDPFSAKIFLSLESDLMRKFNSERIESLLNVLDIGDDYVIKSPLISKAIIGAQKRHREINFAHRIGYDFISQSEYDIWLSYSKLLNGLNNSIENSNDLSINYITELAESFVNSRLSNFIHDFMNYRQSEMLVNEIIKILPSLRNEDFIPASFGGKKSNFVLERITQTIVQKIVVKNNDDKVQTKHYYFLVDLLSTYYCVSKRADNDFQEINESAQQEIEEAFGDMFDLISNIDLNEYAVINDEDIEKVKSFCRSFRENFRAITRHLYDECFSWLGNHIDCLYNSYNNLKYIHSRNQYKTAYWSIISIFVKYEEQKNELRMRLKAKELPLIDFQRLFSKGILSSWQTLCMELPVIIVENLLCERTMLDELFIWEDNEDFYYQIPKDDTFDKKWEMISGEIGNRSLKSKLFIEYVDEYITTIVHKINFNDKFSMEDLKYILMEFLSKCSIESMQNSEGVLKAFEIWKIHEEVISIPQEIRKYHFKLVRDFLIYLSEKNVIGKMPTLRNYFSSIKRDIVDGVKNFNNIVAISSAFTCAVLFFIVTMLGSWLPPLNFQIPGFSLIDNALFLGLLQKGIITAPIFAITLLKEVNVPLTRMVISLTAAVCFSYFTLQPVNLLECMNFIFITITLSMIYYFFVTQIKNIELYHALSLSSLWIILCFTLLLLPSLFDIGTRMNVFLVMFLIGYYLFAHEKISRIRLTFNVTHIKDNITLSSQEIQTERYLSGYSKATPQLMGLVFSCTLYVSLNQIINNVDVLFFISLTSYMVVMSLVIIRRLISRFPIDEISKKIIVSGLTLKNRESKANNITNYVQKARFLLISKEIVLQVFILLIVSFLLKDNYIPTTSIPLCFVIISIAVVFSNHCKLFLTQIINLFSIRRIAPDNSFDFEDVKTTNEKEPENKRFKKLMRLINPIASLRKFVVFLWFCLVIIVTLVNGVDAITRIVNYIKNLF